MEKKIEIKCSGTTALPYQDLVPFQGNLKSLHKDDYEKLRKQIVELGFSDPFAVWKSGNNHYILNGHQRLRAVKTMVEQEGFFCPPLPVIFVEAEDEFVARRKVLALTSQFGKIEKQGLYEFIHEAEISAEELVSGFRLPELDLPNFVDEFFESDKDPLDVSGIEPNSQESGEGRVHSQGVKMVQLFFNADDHQVFEQKVEQLKQSYGTDNVTDTVLRALVNA